MSTLYWTRGLPACGKTTRAREFILQNPRAVRVNRDDLRLLMHEGRFSKGNEKLVTDMQASMIATALADGRDVYCDDTNLADRTVKHLERVAAGHKMVCVDMTDIPLRVCIERDAKRERSVGEHVIRNMWERYLQPPKLKSNGNPRVALIDVDGTIALHNGRSPYDWSRVSDDLPNQSVIAMVRSLPSALSVDLVVVSGRDGSCRADTEAWLARHGIPYLALFMRPAGDTRPDWEVKSEILNNDILSRWEVVVCVDDRQQVVDTYRCAGLEVWQVAAGRF